MVAQNSLSPGRWVLKRFEATVANDIWPGVLFYTLLAVSTYRDILLLLLLPNFALVVYLVSILTKTNLGFSTTILPIIATMLGLVICNRAAEAYQGYVRWGSRNGVHVLIKIVILRYQAGRKTWASIGAASKNLAQLVRL